MSISPTSSTNVPEGTISERIRVLTLPEVSKNSQPLSSGFSPALYVHLAMRHHLRAVQIGLLDQAKFLDLMESKIEEAISMKDYLDAK